MGFYFRKSKNFGFGKLNFSNSGIGFSTGIKGLRFGIDSKGREYISGGKGIFRFREYLSSSSNHENNLISNEPTFKNKKNAVGCYGCGLVISLLLCAIFPPLGAILLLLFFYLLPWIIADVNNLQNKNKIYYLNWLLGWTIIGWFLILGMAIVGINKNRTINKLENNLTIDNIQNIDNILDKLLKINPQNSQKYKLKVIEIYKENEEYQKALDLLDNSYLGETRQLKMQLLAKLEHYQDVINMLQKEFTEDEKNEHPVLYAFMAEMFMKMNKADIAIEALRQGPINARKMSDEMCAFRYALGECYEAVGDIENAKKQYQKVYAYNSSFKNIAEKINL